MKIKRRLIPLTSIFVVVILLATAVGALAAQAPGDETFTLVGPISAGAVPNSYVVKGQQFLLDPTVACTPVAPAPCPPLAGTLVEVTGYISAADTFYYATTITVKLATDTFTYTGELMSFDDTAWVIDDYSFLLVAAPATELPAFYAVGDTIKATYTVAVNGDYLASKFELVESGEGNTYTYVGFLEAFTADSWTVDTYVFDVTGVTLPPFFAVGDEVQVVFSIVAGENVASEVSVLNSAGEYTYEGELTAFTDTEWTVGDYTFTLGPDVVLPPYFGVHDIVEVTFSIVDGEMVASAVRVVETYVPDKVESARCENRLKDHPAVVKLAQELGEDPVVLTEYFCKGFGVGEIKLAYKYATGDYTPGMLLALRAQGMSWGEIKHLMAGQPTDDDDEDMAGEKSKTKDKDKDQDHSNNGVGPDKDKDNNGKGPDPEKSNNGNGKGKNK